MIVSQDGGIPLACKNWDGNCDDTRVFKERAKALVKIVETA
ncbi:MAG: transposase [Colwellia sp.]|jgi:transposase